MMHIITDALVHPEWNWTQQCIVSRQVQELQECSFCIKNSKPIISICVYIAVIQPNILKQTKYRKYLMTIIRME